MTAALAWELPRDAPRVLDAVQVGVLRKIVFTKLNQTVWGCHRRTFLPCESLLSLLGVVRNNILLVVEIGLLQIIGMFFRIRSEVNAQIFSFIILKLIYGISKILFVTNLN